MEIPAWIYFSFWSFAGAFSLFFGINFLDKTDLPNSISPLILSFFKYILAISISHSSTYSLIIRPKLLISPERYYMWLFFAIFPLIFSHIAGESFAWYFPIYSFINLFGIFYYFLPEMKILIADDYIYNVMCPAFALFPLVYFLGRAEPFLWYYMMYIMNFMIFATPGYLALDNEEHNALTVHFFVLSSIYFVDGTAKYFPVIVLFIAFFTSVLWAAFSGDERFQKWLPGVVREHGFFISLKDLMMKNGKLIEFATGMVGTILFQYFFRLTTFDHVLAFLYLTVVWLSNMALLMSSWDFGIFNFFLTNVIVGCTVSQFGLQGTTWLVYGASLLLYSLRLKMESLSLVRRGVEERLVLVWGED